MSLSFVLTECAGDGTVIDQCERRCICQHGRLVKCTRIRKDWATLTAAERKRYIDAVLAISSDPTYKSHYEALIVKYKKSYKTAAQDSNPSTSQFFVFNRYFLLEYENLLREVDCRITIPYWDWTALPPTPYIAAVWANQNGFGDTSRPSDHCVIKGPFRFGVFYQTAGGGCVQREYHSQTYPTRPIIERDLLTRPGSEFEQFHRFFQIFIHTNVRCFVGGTMCSTSAANDPIYLVHLSMVDYIYDRWQRLSADRLHARYADDNTPLALSGGLTVTQFHNNDDLPGGVAVNYAEPILTAQIPGSPPVGHALAASDNPGRSGLHMGCLPEDKIDALFSSADKDYFKKQCART